MSDGRTLIEAEIPRLRRYARALLRNPDGADDLVQETLLRAILKLHLWQPDTDMRAWLFTLMHNQYVNQIRRSVREGRMCALAPTHDAGHGPAQPDVVALRDLGDALDQLPDEQRATVMMIGVEGMRYEEVAARIGVPVGTVRSRLSRARDALRTLTGEAARPVDGRISDRRLAAATVAGRA